MRFFRVVAVIAILGVSSHAWAQYGMYGTPEVLPLSQARPPAQYGYHAPPRAWAHPTPTASQMAAPPPSYASVYQPARSVYEPAVATAWPGPAARPNVAVRPQALPPGRRYPDPSVPIPPSSALAYGPPNGGGSSPSDVLAAPDPATLPQSQSVVDQMLRESGNYPAPIDGSSHRVFNPRPFGSSFEADSTTGYDPYASECAPSDPGFQPKWYFGAAGFLVGRNSANRFWTTYESGNNSNQLTRTPNSS